MLLNLSQHARKPSTMGDFPDSVRMLTLRGLVGVGWRTISLALTGFYLDPRPLQRIRMYEFHTSLSVYECDRRGAHQKRHQAKPQALFTNGANPSSSEAMFTFVKVATPLGDFCTELQSVTAQAACLCPSHFREALGNAACPPHGC